MCLDFERYNRMLQSEVLNLGCSPSVRNLLLPVGSGEPAAKLEDRNME